MTNIFERNQVNKLYRYICGDGTKFIFFTKLDSEGALNLCLTTGSAVYLHQATEETLDELVNDTSCGSKDVFLSTISAAVSTGEISVSEQYGNYKVRFMTTSCSFDVSLLVSTAAQRNVLMKYVVFEMAERQEELTNEVKDLNEKLTTSSCSVKRPAASNENLTFNDPGFKRTKQAKSQKSVKGGSIINPGTRKKKAATGIIFDED